LQNTHLIKPRILIHFGIALTLASRYSTPPCNKRRFIQRGVHDLLTMTEKSATSSDDIQIPRKLASFLVSGGTLFGKLVGQVLTLTVPIKIVKDGAPTLLSWPRRPPGLLAEGCSTWCVLILLASRHVDSCLQPTHKHPSPFSPLSILFLRCHLHTNNRFTGSDDQQTPANVLGILSHIRHFCHAESRAVCSRSPLQRQPFHEDVKLLHSSPQPTSGTTPFI
jgi:hypothetical protein